MQNVSMQLCGILLIFLIIYLSNKRKFIRLKSINAYFIVLYSSLVCLTLDIVSVLFIRHMNEIPSYIVDFICKGYLISSVVVSYSILNYLIIELHHRDEYITLRKITFSSLIFFSVMIMALPISIYEDRRFLYTYGASVKLAYAVAVGYILLIIYISTKFKDEITNVRRKSIIFWVCILLTAAIIQYFNNKLLLIGFSVALGLTFLYSEIENPVSYIDKESGLYNREMLRKYLYELLSKGEKFSGLAFILESNAVDFTNDRKKRLVVKVSDYLLARKDIISFRNEVQSFAVYIEKEEDLNNIFEDINDFIQNDIKGEEPSIDVSYILLGDSSCIIDIDDASRLYQYARLNNLKDNIVYVDDELIERLNHREYIKNKIINALHTNRIIVFFQPIYDTRKKKFTSAEALVRMVDLDGRIHPPSEFISVAEESGLIIDIGEKVFENVCKFLNTNDVEALGIDYIEVNLSALQCEQYDLYERFNDIMKSNNVNASQINLEITETLQLNNTAVSNKNIKDFKNGGISFSLDDFGTGNSNLDYITTMPVSIVKFDYTMTQGYFKNERTRTIFKYVIPMIKSLNMEIVCEGVETEEQLNTMIGFGIEHIQGYYFSKPLSENDYIKFLKENNK